MLLLTSKEINQLSKSIKKTFTFSRIADLLKPIIKTEMLSDMLSKAIGQKADDSIKNGASLELVTSIIGTNDINFAIAEAKKNENKTKHQIKDGLKSILLSLEEDDYSFQYNQALSTANENIISLKNSSLVEKELNQCLKSKSEDENDTEEDLKDELTILNILKSVIDSTAIDIVIDSYNESGSTSYELSYVLTFENKTVIDLNLNIDTDPSTGMISQILTYKSTFNDISLDNLSIDLTDIIIEIIDFNFDQKISKPKNKQLTDEQLKKLSLFLSQI